MKLSIKLVAIFVASLLVITTFWPAIRDVPEIANGTDQVGTDLAERPFSDLSGLVISLMEKSTNTTDTDADGLYDSVERVIGLNPLNPDSDYDMLDDYYEVMNGLDPLKADSNGDGFPDLYEVSNVPNDVDNDGVPNAWDNDNDNDGVDDDLDPSPFVASGASDRFKFGIKTNGNPLFLEFQIRTVDASHMLLVDQVWNWTDFDLDGTMKDLDGSADDVTIMPALVWTVDTYFKVSNAQNGKYLEVDGSGAVALGTFEGTDAELWKLVSTGSGYIEIVNKQTGTCLEVTSSSFGDLAAVGLNTFNGDNCQLWSMQYNADGTALLSARHSGKMLDVSTSGISVCQNAESFENDQNWNVELAGDGLASQEEVSAYGISNAIDSAYIPLYPVYQDGEIVALSGRMAYPTVSPEEVLANMTLEWRVMGASDVPAKALMDTSGSFVSLNDDNEMVLSAIDTEELRKLEWVELGGDTVAMKTANGLYVSVGNDGRLTATAPSIGSRETFTWTSNGVGKLFLKTYSNAYVYHDAEGKLITDATLKDTFSVQNYTDYARDQTFLASYNDSFYLTGLSISEEYGTDAGLFYSLDNDDWFGGNLDLNFKFLHNSSNDLVDMGAILVDDYIDMTADIGSYPNQDLALANVTGSKIPLASELLSDGTTHPMIMALQTSISAADLTNMTVDGSSLTIDMASRNVEETRTLKTIFYNSSAGGFQAVEKILLEATRWVEGNESFSDIAAFLLVWNKGETTITAINGIGLSFAAAPNLKFAGQDWTKGAIKAVSFIVKTWKVVDKMIKGWAFAKEMIKAGTWASTLSSFKMLKNGMSSVPASSLSKAANIAGKIMMAIEIILVLFIFGYSLYTILTTMDSNSPSFNAAIAMSTLTMIYGLAVIAIGCIPVVGWIIALVIGICELISWFVGWLTGYGGSMSQWFVEWLISWMQKITQLTYLDLNIFQTYVTTVDPDKNGMTLGDTIRYDTIIRGRTYSWTADYAGYVYGSYISPYISIPVPAGSLSSNSTGLSNFIRWEGWANGYTYDRYYVTGAWIKPGISMSNFPVTVKLHYDYQIWYNERWWILFVPYDQKKTYTGDSTADMSTFYVDVMPASLDDFLNWSMVRPLDTDRDGLPDRNETSTDMWKWDSDGDGLSDNFEDQLGSDPTKIDTDGEGLNDGAEVRTGTNVTLDDTDGDGVPDGVEENGWVAVFDYCGTEYQWWVRSDPQRPDADADGLSDLQEYWSNLNPRSNDTNGDGTNDVASMNIVTATDYVDQWGLSDSWSRDLADPVDVAVATDGSIYVADQDESVIVKLDADGNYLTSIRPSLLNFMTLTSVAVDKDGYVYAADSGTKRILKFDPDGFVVDQWGMWGTGDGQFSSIAGIAVSGTGMVYATDPDLRRVQVFDPDGTFNVSFGDSGPYGLIRPTAVDVGPDGSVYVLDRGNDVMRFTWNGTVIDRWEIFGREARGLAVAADGTVIVSAEKTLSGKMELEIYTSDGTLIVLNDCDGQLDEASGLDIVEDSVFVADGGDRSVKRFDLDLEGYGLSYSWRFEGDRMDLDHVSIALYDDLVYLTNGTEDGVFVYHADGSYIGRFVGDNDEGPDLVAPTWLAVDDEGSVYIIDDLTVKKFDQDGNLLTNWSGEGSPDLPDHPDTVRGIAVNHDHVYVLYDNATDWRVITYTKDGSYLREFGGQGDDKNGIAVDPDGNVYLTDGAGVQKLAPDGDRIMTFGQGLFIEPTAVQLSQDRRLFVLDQGTGLVSKFDANGDLITKFGPDQPDHIYSLAVSQFGSIFLVDDIDEMVFVYGHPFDLGLNVTSYGTGVGAFEGVAFDELGNIMVSDTYRHRLQSYDLSGSSLGMIGEYGRHSGDLCFPGGLVVNDTGYLFVADAGNDRIQVFGPNGIFAWGWGSPGTGEGQFDVPTGLALDSEGFIYVVDSGNDRVQKFNSTNGEFVMEWGCTGPGSGQFNAPTGIAIDVDDNIYVADTRNDRIQKFDADGDYIFQWGSTGTDQGQFSLPTGIAADEDGFVYVSDTGNDRMEKFYAGGRVPVFVEEWYGNTTYDVWLDAPSGLTIGDGVLYVVDSGNDRIQIWTSTGSVSLVPDPSVSDTDGDGLTDQEEMAGWTVTYVHSKKTVIINVTSDPFAFDSDLDGLSDLEESELGLDPSNADTDGDGLNDGEEIGIYNTYPDDDDTDNDMLDDGQEINLWCDPNHYDTDRDKLLDTVELLFSHTNPLRKDSDGDGMDDWKEYFEWATNPNDPDSDDDMVFDSAESKSNANVKDSDADGLIDGFEIFFGTDPNDADTDDDGVIDGKEIYWRIDPLDPDTDGDGLTDGEEITYGTYPQFIESDGDGINDLEDKDTYIAYPGSLTLVADPSDDSTEFRDNIAYYSEVTSVSVAGLYDGHLSDERIVLIGTPGEGEVGDLIASLLADCGTVLDEMSTDYGRVVVRNGVWTPTQTVVMLLEPRFMDHLNVLGILREKVTTVQEGYALVQYGDDLRVLDEDMDEYDYFGLNDIDVVKHTDTMVAGMTAVEDTRPVVEITRNDDATTSHRLNRSTGLRAWEASMGKYVQVDIEDATYQGTNTYTTVHIRVYFTADELDLNGDGDIDDLFDLNESYMKLFYYDEARGSWRAVDPSLDWVVDGGVNTTDVTIYGTAYTGYAWATINRTCSLAIGGMMNVLKEPTVATQCIIDEIGDLGLHRSTTKSLTAHLEIVIDKIQRGRYATAANTLSSFISMVEAHTGKRITQEDSDAIIGFSWMIIAYLEDPMNVPK